MKGESVVGEKRFQIDRIRRREVEAGLDLFTRGQLAGAQQALHWVLEIGLDPARAILSDSQIASIEAADPIAFGGYVENWVAYDLKDLVSAEDYENPPGVTEPTTDTENAA